MKLKSLSLVAAGAFCWWIASAQAQSPSSTSARPSQTASATQSQTSGDPVRGQATWNRVGCFTCHGYAAQGAEGTAPKLSGRDFPLPVFAMIVRHPANQMPPYSEKMLSDSDLGDIMAYVNSIDVGPKK